MGEVNQNHPMVKEYLEDAQVIITINQLREVKETFTEEDMLSFMHEIIQIMENKGKNPRNILPDYCIP